MERTKKMVMTALLASLTCISTLIIRIPTPTMGYIHPGDGFVLICGLLLGPLWGGFAAGLGSALSDFIAGYMIYVPGTFFIKALAAAFACVVYEKMLGKHSTKPLRPMIILAGICGEELMVIGYFLYEIPLLAGEFTSAGIKAAALASLSGIPANEIQTIFGVAIATILFPVINRINNKL